MTFDLRCFTGTVVTKADPTYDDARTNYNTRIAKYPAAIVFCETTDDVRNALTCVRRQNLPFRIRSGRHSYEELSLMDEGIIIDVSHLKRFEIQQTEAGAIAVVGAGVTQGEAYSQVAEQGYAIAAGTAPDVGIAGVSLGGGIGMLTRQVGLALDNLISIELVTPQGDLLTASATENPDLFWALRGGGGGNFGIATAFAFRIHPISTVTIYQLKWPYHQLEAVMDYWQRWAPETDRRLTCQLTLHTAQSGKGVTSEGLFLGSPADLRPLLDQWAAAVEPVYFHIEQTSFYESTGFFAASDDLNCHPFKTTGAFVYEPLPADGLATIKRYLDEAPNDDCALWMQSFGGAMADRRPDETAFFHRGAKFIFEFASVWHASDPASMGERCSQWAENFRTALQPYTYGTYANFVDLQIPNWLEMYYGANVERLRTIKTQVDPENRFHFEQSIPPLHVPVGLTSPTQSEEE